MSQSNQSPPETRHPHDHSQPGAESEHKQAFHQVHGLGSALLGDVSVDRTLRDAWLLSLLGVIVFFLLTVRQLVSMDCLFLEDAWEQFWPWFSYLADSLAAGRFPLWEPHSSCGFPFHANPQAGVFYPVYGAAALALGGGYKVFQSLWLFHWLCAVVGLFFLLKRMGLSPLGAFAGSVTFGFSGFFIANAEHTVFINVVSYVPWVLLVLDAAHEEHLAYALLAGVLLGIAGLSGYPGVFWYSLVMVVLWSVLRYGLSRRTAATAGILVVVAGIVVSPAYVSFLVEGSGYTDRVGALDLKTACDSGRFPLSAMISLIVPQFTVSFRELIDSDISMTDGYFGLLGLVAVLVTVVHAPLRRRWKWLLIWMLVAWLFSLGSTGGIRVVAYYVLPVLRYSRHSGLFRVFWLMGGAILAGVLIDRLLSVSTEDRARIVWLALRMVALVLCACVCVLLWIAIVPQHNASTISGLRGTGAQIAIAAGCLIALVLYSRSLVPRTMFAVLIVLLLLADLTAHFSGNRVLVCAEGDGAAVAAGFEAVSGAKARAPLTGIEKRLDAPRFHPNQGLFDREFYIRSYNPASSPDYDFLVGGSVAGSASPPVRTPFLSVLEHGPRFWLTPEVAYADARDRKALKALQGSGFPAAVPVFVHARVTGVADWPGSAVLPGTYGTAQVMHYQPESIRLRVDAPGDAWLFCAERYAPGWQASVDGKPTVLRKADFCFRAVQVPQGVHDIRLQYDPWLYKPLWLVSWCTILVVLAGFALFRVRGLSRQ